MATSQGVGKPVFEEDSFGLFDKKQVPSNRIGLDNGSDNGSPTLLKEYRNSEPLTPRKSLVAVSCVGLKPMVLQA